MRSAREGAQGDAAERPGFKGSEMSRPQDPADMRYLLIEALDETGREYELTDKVVGHIPERNSDE